MSRHKLVDFETLETTERGGKIRINTASVDRDRDRVFPSGAQIGNYMKNPVVQWGHNYRDPWATIGKTTGLDVTAEFIDATFELRPPANEADPQNIVLLLWAGGWVRTASIGFSPFGEPDEQRLDFHGRENEFGGMDFMRWELLEWSLVPIPANQDALRLAAKALILPPAPQSPVEVPEPLLPERALEELAKTLQLIKGRFVKDGNVR